MLHIQGKDKIKSSFYQMLIFSYTNFYQSSTFSKKSELDTHENTKGF